MTLQIHAAQEDTRGQEEWRGMKETWRRVRGSEEGRQSRKELETAACLPAHGKEIHFGLSTSPHTAHSSVHSLVQSLMEPFAILSETQHQQLIGEARPGGRWS